MILQKNRISASMLHCCIARSLELHKAVGAGVIKNEWVQYLILWSCLHETMTKEVVMNQVIIVVSNYERKNNPAAYIHV